MAGLPKEIFIVVSENNGVNNTPVAFESELFDYESALKFANRVGSRYGRCAIYKAEIIEEIKLGVHNEII